MWSDCPTTKRCSKKEGECISIKNRANNSWQDEDNDN